MTKEELTKELTEQDFFFAFAKDPFSEETRTELADEITRWNLPILAKNKHGGVSSLGFIIYESKEGEAHWEDLPPQEHPLLKQTLADKAREQLKEKAFFTGKEEGDTLGLILFEEEDGAMRGTEAIAHLEKGKLEIKTRLQN